MLLNNFIFSVDSVLPVFLLMAMGVLASRKGVLDRRAVSKMNWLVFNMALPMMLFMDMAESELSDMLDAGLILFSVSATLASFAIAWAASLKAAGRDERGAFIQGCFRGNYAILGVNIASNIAGPSQTGKAALILAFVVPLYNILATIALQANAKGEASATFKGVALGVAKNPLIISVALGVAASAARVRPPVFLASALRSMGGMATPLALIAIGASLDAGELRRKLRPAIAASAFKLVAIPAMFAPVAALAFGFRGESLAAILVMCGAPTAASSYIMAESMGNDGVLAANIIMITTVFSILTLTLGVFAAKSLGWL
jgi:predicted permease